jgi:hypothetical protein
VTAAEEEEVRKETVGCQAEEAAQVAVAALLAKVASLAEHAATVAEAVATAEVLEIHCMPTQHRCGLSHAFCWDPPALRLQGFHPTLEQAMPTQQFPIPRLQACSTTHPDGAFGHPRHSWL